MRRYETEPDVLPIAIELRTATKKSVGVESRDLPTDLALEAGDIEAGDLVDGASVFDEIRPEEVCPKCLGSNGSDPRDHYSAALFHSPSDFHFRQTKQPFLCHERLASRRETPLISPMNHSPSGKSNTSPFRKEKVGFWCPPDVDEGVQKLLDEGRYQDRSKAFVDLVRKGLKSEKQLSPGVQKNVGLLGRILDREPEAIVNQCVEGVLTLINSDGTEMPLIFEEIRLRKNREKRPIPQP